MVSGKSPRGDLAKPPPLHSGVVLDQELHTTRCLLSSQTQKVFLKEKTPPRLLKSQSPGLSLAGQLVSLPAVVPILLAK